MTYNDIAIYLSDKIYNKLVADQIQNQPMTYWQCRESILSAMKDLVCLYHQTHECSPEQIHRLGPQRESFLKYQGEQIIGTFAHDIIKENRFAKRTSKDDWYQRDEYSFAILDLDKVKKHLDERRKIEDGTLTNEIKKSAP